MTPNPLSSIRDWAEDVRWWLLARRVRRLERSMVALHEEMAADG